VPFTATRTQLTGKATTEGRSGEGSACRFLNLCARQLAARHAAARGDSWRAPLPDAGLVTRAYVVLNLSRKTISQTLNCASSALCQCAARQAQHLQAGQGCKQVAHHASRRCLCQHQDRVPQIQHLKLLQTCQQGRRLLIPAGTWACMKVGRQAGGRVKEAGRPLSAVAMLNCDSAGTCEPILEPNTCMQQSGSLS
jgi:hypothetical protein